MKRTQPNINDWLQREAHVVAGPSFQFEDCSCVPVTPESLLSDSENPVGFLVTHGGDVTYVSAQTLNGKQILTAWTRNHLDEMAKEDRTLPSEYWYG